MVILPDMSPATVALFLLALVPSLQACPMCKNALASGGDCMVNGYFWGIVFMLMMPALILALFAGLVWHWRKQMKVQTAPLVAAQQSSGQAPER